MAECTRCGWTGPAGVPNCPRCGQPFAPPAPPSRPTLVLELEAADLPPEKWEVTDATLTIGRLDESSDITIPHKSVSRQHARVLPSATGFEIEDLGSTNGTYLNDQPISDRAPLSNNDVLTIGDVPVRVVLRQTGPVQVTPVVPEPRWPQPQSQVQSQPHPLPGPERPVPSGGPSTVYYDLDDALAQAQPEPQGNSEVPTAWDVKPARPIGQVQPQAEAEVVEQPTLVGAEVPIEPLPPPPPPTREPRPADHDITALPFRDPRPTSAVDPRPTPALDPQPVPRQTPAQDRRPTPALDPLPVPPIGSRNPPGVERVERSDVAQRVRPESTPPRELTGPSREPRPTPALDPLPTPALDPLPTPSRDPLPTPARDPLPTPVVPATDSRGVVRVDPQDVAQRVRPESTPAREATGPAAELSAVALIDLADRLALALRQFKGDSNLALWLFDHAGGADAAHAFVRQAQRLQHAPDDPRELTALLESVPTAARLLEAAVLLANVVSSLGTQSGTDNEVEPNATDLQPVART